MRTTIRTAALIVLALVPLVGGVLLAGERMLSAQRQQAPRPAERAIANVALPPELPFVPTPTERPSTADAVDESATTLYVAHTGGRGVALRPECRDDARTDEAWPEQLAATVIEEGAGSCEGWTLMESGGDRSWVRSGYLDDEPPVATVGLAPEPAPPLAFAPTTAPAPSACGPATPGPQHQPAPSLTPPFIAYGTGLCPGDRVEVFVAGVSCGLTTAGADEMWTFMISVDDPCSPRAGATITFALNGRLTAATETYSAGGTPADRANGVALD